MRRMFGPRRLGVAAGLMLWASGGAAMAAQAHQAPAPARPATIAPDPLGTRDATDLTADLTAGRTTSVALVDAFLARIAALDDAGPELNAVLALMPHARAEAQRLDAERRAGTVRGPLHGLPVLIKDNIDVAGPVPTTAGSLALAGNVTNRDAPLVARLRAAGAIILGKTNLSEWANMRDPNSTSGWSAVGGLTRNPHATDRNTCGSSSGSGAGMAAGLAALTVGTETDGSIVCPSGTNGIVGLKPTVGLVSRTHVIPISASQDSAGPMTASVRDAAMMLTVMAGTDPADPATREADARRRDYARGLSRDGLKGQRIGVMRDRLGTDARMLTALDAALDRMRGAGATIVDIADTRTGFEQLRQLELPILLNELKTGLAAYFVGTPAGVPKSLRDVIAFNTAHPREELRWFGQAFLEQSDATTSDDKYAEARLTARRIAGEEGIDRLMQAHGVDLLLGISNGPAWPTNLVSGDAFTGPSASQLPAMAGYPHITVPLTTVEGLPVGLSLIATKWDEARLLNAAHAYTLVAPPRPVPSLRPWRPAP